MHYDERTIKNPLYFQLNNKICICSELKVVRSYEKMENIFIIFFILNNFFPDLAFH